MMDAFEIGLALAFPEGVLLGLEEAGEDFALLDAAAVAAGEDPVQAAGLFQELELGWAPADQDQDQDQDETETASASAIVGEIPTGPEPTAARAEVPRGGRGQRARSDDREAGKASLHGLLASDQAIAPHGLGLRDGNAGEGPGAVRAEQADADDEGAPTVLISVVPAPKGRASAVGSRRGPQSGGGRLASPGGGPGRSGRSALAAYAQGVRDRIVATDSLAPAEVRGDRRAVLTAEVYGAGAGDDPGDPAVATSPRRLETWASPQRPGRPGAGGETTGWREGSAAPAAMGGVSRGVNGSRGVFDGQAVAPSGGGERGRSEGSRPVVLDGRLVGQWVSEQMARDAARPGAGTTFFDPRQAPAWTPSGSL